MPAAIQAIHTPKRARVLDSSTSVEPVGPDLITNGDFATDTSGLGTNWTSYNNTNDTEAISTGNGFPGNAQKVTSGGNGSGGTANTFVYQALPSLENHTTYEFSYYQRSTQGLTAYILEHTATDQLLNNNHSANTGNATKHTLRFTTGSSTGSAQIRFYARLTGADAVSGDIIEFGEVTLHKCETSNSSNHGQIYSGRALEFDGVNDYLGGISSTLVPYLSVDKDFTVACWIYVDTFADANIFTAWLSAYDGVTLSIGADGEISFASYDGAYAYASGGAEGSAAIKSSTWYRVVCTRTSTDILKLYINGVLQTGTAKAFVIPLSAASSGFYIGLRNTNLTGIFTGKLSDFQAWDSIWTQSDVTYDYLNPESLALNNAGTSLTESNLKLWYPMQDGHRGQQSYILDGANTGLGDELVANGTFTSGTTGWQGNDGLAGLSIESGRLRVTNNDNTAAGFSTPDGSPTFSTVAGVTYSISYDSYQGTSSNALTRFYLGTSFNGANVLEGGISTTDGTHTEHFTATASQAVYLLIKNFTTTSGEYMEYGNISVKAVNAKNHIATKFYGDNLTWSNHLIATTVTELGGNISGASMVFGGADSDGCDGSAGIGALDSIMTTASDRQMDGGGWTLGGGFAIGSNVAQRSGADGSAYGTMLHTGTATIVADRFYLISYDVDAISGGDVEVSVGSTYAYESSVTGTIRRVVRAEDDSKMYIRAGKSTNITMDDVGLGLVDGFLIRRTTAGVDTASDLTIDSGTLKATNNGTNKAEIILPLIVEAGRTYRVKATCTAGEIKVGLGRTTGLVSTDVNPSMGSAITATATGYSNESSGGSIGRNTSLYLYIQNNSAVNNAVFNVNNISLQEVGQATGWTDADQQPDIPQPALQSYNQLAWFQDNKGTNNPYGYTANHADFNPGTGDFTVSAWILQADYHDDNYFFAQGGGGASGWYFRTTSPNGYLLFGVEGNDDELTNNGNPEGTDHVTFTTSAIGLGEWVHCVGIIDTTAQRIKIYMNGVYKGYATIENMEHSDISHSTGPLKFGSWSTSYAGGVVNGTHTEWSVWKGIAFSDEQVSELYNGGKALNALDHSAVSYLKGYWRNGGLSPTWKDLTSYGRDVTFLHGKETLLIPAGVDNSRDTQGFIMNRQRTTNSLNLPNQLNQTTYTYGQGVLIRAAQDRDYGDFDANGDGTGDFTIECWVKYDYVNTDQGSSIFTTLMYDDPSTANYAGFEILATTGGSISFKACFDDSWGLAYTLGSEAYLNDGEWHYIVGVFDRSANFYLIVDGHVRARKVISEYPSGASAGTDLTGRSLWKFPIQIGAERLGGTYYGGHGVGRNSFDGELDDLKIYNRVLTFDTDGSIAVDELITSGEVLRNYKAGKRNHRDG